MCLETLSSAEAAGGKLSAFAKADAWTVIELSFKEV